MKSAMVLLVSAIWDFSQVDSVMNTSLLRLVFDSLKQNRACPWWEKNQKQNPNRPCFYVIISSLVFQEINIGICVDFLCGILHTLLLNNMDKYSKID